MRSSVHLLLACGLLFLALHFFFVGCYAWPPEQGKGPWIAWRYTYPFFQQNWNLFVPVPDYRLMILVDYRQGGRRYRYDLFAEVSGEHQRNRFAGKEALVVALANSCHFLYQSPGADEDPAYRKSSEVLAHAVRNYLLATRGEDIEDLRFRVVSIHGEKLRLLGDF